ncbi:MAG TPA: hypothetical protein ENI82_05270 [Bacteroidetes bacterium]|nr:hypothetical protein [Bacteroidota bacterium]
MINRENYEIWFLDYFEGDLSEDDIRILYDFLDKNPELKEEFNDFELLTLDAGKATFNKKDNLKQNLNIDTIADLDEFETLAVKDLEGEISKTEKAELNSILRFSEEKNKEFLAFNHTILKPEKDLIYKNKESLKRKPGLVIPMWLKYAVSAAAILLIILFVKNINIENSNNPDNNIKLAENNQNQLQESKTIAVKENTPLSQNIKENIIEQKYPQKEEKSENARVLTQKELKKEKNNIGSIASVPIKISLPDNTSTLKIRNIIPGLKPVELVERKQETILTSSENTSRIVALTPKEFIIKTVKKKLDIDDNNYDKINPVEMASASLEKLKIAKVDYKENPKTKKKHFAFNIRGFGIERSWVSN